MGLRASGLRKEIAFGYLALCMQAVHSDGGDSVLVFVGSGWRPLVRLFWELSHLWPIPES